MASFVSNHQVKPTPSGDNQEVKVENNVVDDDQFSEGEIHSEGEEWLPGNKVQEESESDDMLVETKAETKGMD